MIALRTIGWLNGGIKEALSMNVPFVLGEAQMRRIEPFFPPSPGVPRVDDRRGVSGIIYGIKHGLMWRDAPKGYGPRLPILAMMKRKG